MGGKKKGRESEQERVKVGDRKHEKGGIKKSLGEIQGDKYRVREKRIEKNNKERER